MVRSRTNPAAKPWVPIVDAGAEKPFDQTNGAVDFDVEDAHTGANPARDLLEKGVAANVISIAAGL